MNVEHAVDQLTTSLVEQFKGQMTALLQEAQARIEQLEQELRDQQQARLQAEEQLRDLQHRHACLQQELDQERQTSSAARQEVEHIHAVIAEQLERAEAEQEAEQVVLAEQERRWREQCEALQAELSQERLWRDQLQQRIEALRSAAAELFSADFPAAAITVPDTVNELLATAATPGGS